MVRLAALQRQIFQTMNKKFKEYSNQLSLSDVNKEMLKIWDANGLSKRAWPSAKVTLVRFLRRAAVGQRNAGYTSCDGPYHKKT